jgi:murein DD-endopeptidase MepM/ murein hydrolase activator NlpD
MDRILQVAVSGAVVSTALIVLTTGSARRIQETPVATPIVVSKAYEERTDRLRRNETLSHMFARHSVEGPALAQLLEAARPRGLDPRRVTPNQVFEFRYIIGRTVPDRVRTRISEDAFLLLQRNAAGEWGGALDAIRWTVVRERAAGSITSSLNDAVHAAIPDSILGFGYRDRLIWNVAEDVYGWVIDFTRDPRPGDRFEILYERLVSSAGDVRYGRLLASSIETGGRPNTAYVMSDEQNRNVYYDGGGRSLKRAFLRYPVQFRRISGGYGRRFHPVLRQYRAHLGTDYAAVTGTPVYATADGEVTRAGRWGGYGLVVTIRHPKDIETRYAHMSRVHSGIKPGVRVRQGEIIGYVGMTGLATGPHVHYEFLKNDRQVDSRGVDMGDGDPVPESLRAEFEAVRAAFNLVLFDSTATDRTVVAKR